jgi:hypothetical protein
MNFTDNKSKKSLEPQRWGEGVPGESAREVTWSGVFIRFLQGAAQSLC